LRADSSLAGQVPSQVLLGSSELVDNLALSCEQFLDWPVGVGDHGLVCGEVGVASRARVSSAHT
jgi:hypothetical protein